MAGMYLARLDNILQAVTLLIVFILVLGLCVFTTRWIGNYQKKTASRGNIEIIEYKSISNAKGLAIARIGKEYFALAIGKEEIHVISKIDEENITFIEPTEKGANMESFKDLLDKFKNGKNKPNKPDKQSKSDDSKE